MFCQALIVPTRTQLATRFCTNTQTHTHAASQKDTRTHARYNGPHPTESQDTKEGDTTKKNTTLNFMTACERNCQGQCCTLGRVQVASTGTMYFPVGQAPARNGLQQRETRKGWFCVGFLSQPFKREFALHQQDHVFNDGVRCISRRVKVS